MSYGGQIAGYAEIRVFDLYIVHGVMSVLTGDYECQGVVPKCH